MSDQSLENKVVVKIYGEDYPIMGQSDPDRIERIAKLVNDRMNEVSQSTGVKARDKVAILAAMSIASELLERSDDGSDIKEQVNSELDSLLERLDTAIAS